MWEGENHLIPPNQLHFPDMSCIQNELLLETCYDEAWIDYAVANNLTHDQLDAIDQNSKLGYLPEIADEARRRFEELCQ